MMSAIKSRGMVEIMERYEMVVPSWRCAILFLPSILVTVVLKRKRSWGSVAATAFQMPPVPPLAGKRKVALGPLLR